MSRPIVKRALPSIKGLKIVGITYFEDKFAGIKAKAIELEHGYILWASTDQLVITDMTGEDFSLENYRVPSRRRKS